MADADLEKDEQPSESGINRLLGMVVQEVSLVDRAANKRKFLVVKRQGEMGDKGKKQPVTKQTQGDAAQPGEPGGANQQPDAKLPPMQAQVKDALLAALTSAGEKLVSLASSVKEADTTDQPADPAVADSVLAEIGELASMLQGIVSQYKGGGDQPDAGAAAEPTKASGLGGISENGAQDEQGEQKRDAEAMAKAAALCDQLLKSTKDGQVVVKADQVPVLKAGFEVLAKAGKKMAKERLERFRKALDLLAGIMKELTSDVRKNAGDGKPAPKAPPELVAVAKSIAEIKGALEGTVTQLRKDNSALRERADKLATELHAVRKASGASNALSPEDTPPPAPAREVAWPIDMNHPVAPKSNATAFTK